MENNELDYVYILCSLNDIVAVYADMKTLLESWFADYSEEELAEIFKEVSDGMDFEEAKTYEEQTYKDYLINELTAEDFNSFLGKGKEFIRTQLVLG